MRTLCKSLVIALVLSIAVEARSSEDRLKELKETLSEVMPKPAEFQLFALPTSVLIRGTVASKEDARLAELIASDFFPKVINAIEVETTRPGTRSVDRRQSGHVAKGGKRLKDLHAKLQEIYPDVQLSMLELDTSVVLFGEIDHTYDINTIEKIAEDYYPKVINVLSVGKDASSGDVSHYLDSVQQSDRSATSEISGLRAEVCALRRDVQRLIRLLEVRDVEGESSAATNHDSQLMIPIRGSHPARVTMRVNSSKILGFKGKEIPRALVNNPDLVRAIVVSPNQIQLAGVKAGVTTVNAWDSEGNLYTIDVVILGDTRELEMLLESEFPKATLKARQHGKHLVLSRLVEMPDTISRIIRIAEDYAPKIINNIRVGKQKRLDFRELVMLLETEFPDAKLKVQELPGDRLLLSGSVKRSDTARRIVRMAEAEGYQKIVNNIRVLEVDEE